MTTSSPNPQPTTVDVAPATPRPVNGESPPIARLSPCRAPDGMIASPSASLVHRKYVFQGDVICECGETGCEIATGFQLPKPSPPAKVKPVLFSPISTFLGSSSSSHGCSSSSSQLQQVLRFDSRCSDSHTSSCAGNLTDACESKSKPNGNQHHQQQQQQQQQKKASCCTHEVWDWPKGG